MRKPIVHVIRGLALLLLLFGAAGCLQDGGPAEFHVRIEPARGHVPYEARIVCTTLAGTYVYQLPGGAVVTESSAEIDVVIDSLS